MSASTAPATADLRILVTILSGPIRRPAPVIDEFDKRRLSRAFNSGPAARNTAQRMEMTGLPAPETGCPARTRPNARNR
ncbi:hypothetical protein GCM10020358_61760 [Amorphoplanes nipponensis]|uniref:Uncharacterized protein n=1 Tax=Actinoplanes nipponensis TaxID=135950 RepID=A0A919JVX7_9ACTN|nr:hypothetical protein Ani05nite_75130 [Actinoplanes nipponensis]